MDWTLHKYSALQLLFLLTALCWPSLARAVTGEVWALQHAWELIIGGVALGVPFGAWLGVSIPPPTGFSATGKWSWWSRFLSGLIAGYSTAIILGDRMEPLAITVIPPSVLAAVAGPSLIVVWRARMIKKESQE